MQLVFQNAFVFVWILYISFSTKYLAYEILLINYTPTVNLCFLCTIRFRSLLNQCLLKKHVIFYWTFFPPLLRYAAPYSPLPGGIERRHWHWQVKQGKDLPGVSDASIQASRTALTIQSQVWTSTPRSPFLPLPPSLFPFFPPLPLTPAPTHRPINNQYRPDDATTHSARFTLDITSIRDSVRSSCLQHNYSPHTTARLEQAAAYKCTHTYLSHSRRHCHQDRQTGLCYTVLANGRFDRFRNIREIWRHASCSRVTSNIHCLSVLAGL